MATSTDHPFIPSNDTWQKVLDAPATGYATQDYKSVLDTAKVDSAAAIQPWQIVSNIGAFWGNTVDTFMRVTWPVVAAVINGEIGGLGEANTASNLPGGTGIFAQKVVADLQFKSLVAGTGIGIASDANTITITSNVVGAGEANTASNVGTLGVGVFDAKTSVNLDMRHVAPGSTKVTTVLSGKNILVDVVPGQIGHNSLNTIGPDDHHAELHTIVSHSDTTATGAQLNTLTNGSDVGALHTHIVESLAATSTDEDHVLKPDGVGGVLFGPSPGGGATISGTWRYAAGGTGSSPASGRFTLNTGTSSTSTQMAINSISLGGSDLGRIMARLQTGDFVYVSQEDDGSKYAFYQLTGAPTDNTSWLQLDFTVDEAGGDLVVNERCGIIFLRSGTSGGDVVGPAGGVVDNELSLFNSTTGKLIKGSGTLLSELELVANKGAASGYASLDGSSILVEPAQAIRTTTGPTTLTVGAVADGEALVRSGSTIIGQAAGGASSLNAGVRRRTTTLFGVGTVAVLMDFNLQDRDVGASFFTYSGGTFTAQKSFDLLVYTEGSFDWNAGTQSEVGCDIVKNGSTAFGVSRANIYSTLMQINGLHCMAFMTMANTDDLEVYWYTLSGTVNMIANTPKIHLIPLELA